MMICTGEKAHIEATLPSESHAVTSIEYHPHLIFLVLVIRPSACIAIKINFASVGPYSNCGSHCARTPLTKLQRITSVPIQGTRRLLYHSVGASLTYRPGFYILQHV